MHGKELAEKVLSGSASPGDAKAWQQIYKSMSPQQIEERVRQELQQLQEAENQLRQLLSRYMPQQEVAELIQRVKQSTPYRYTKQLVAQPQQGAQQQQASIPTAVSTTEQRQQQLNPPQQVQQQQTQQPQYIFTVSAPPQQQQQQFVMPKTVAVTKKPILVKA
jgi:exonuclease VII large subunit